MRVFKTLTFHKWANKEKLSDICLLDAVRELQKGLVGVELGGELYKKRLALTGRGKSGGVRTLLAFKRDNCTFFIYGLRRTSVAILIRKN